MLECSSAIEHLPQIITVAFPIVLGLQSCEVCESHQLLPLFSSGEEAC